MQSSCSENPFITGKYILPKWHFFHSKLAIRKNTRKRMVFPASHVLHMLSVSKTSARKLVNHIFNDTRPSCNTHTNHYDLKTVGTGNESQVNRASLRKFKPSDAHHIQKSLKRKSVSSSVENKNNKRVCLGFDDYSLLSLQNQQCNRESKYTSKFIQLFSSHVNKHLDKAVLNEVIVHPEKEKKLTFIQAFQPFLYEHKSQSDDLNFSTKRNMNKKLRIVKHLRKAIDVCYVVLKKSKEVKFDHLLNKYCPLPVFTKKTLVMNEVSSSSEKRQTENYCNLCEMDTPCSRVYLFVCSIISHAFPVDIVWGSKKNEKKFFKGLKTLLYSRRFDKVTINDVISEVEISELSCFKGPQAQESFCKLVKWMIVEFIFMILRRYFYVTEHANFRNRMFYYRREIWAELLDREMELFVANKIWSPVESEIGSNKRSSQPHFSIRFVPRAAGLRPIMKPMKSTLHSKYNILPSSDIFKILKYICKKFPQLLGCAAQGRDDIHLKWRKFWMRSLKLMQSSKLQLLDLYVVKADISRCFDSIPVDELLRIIRNILDRCANLKITPVTKTYTTLIECSDDVYSSLEYYLRYATLDIANKHFTKLKGIPQGWCLSSLLCDIFYGDLEMHYLQDYGIGKERSRVEIDSDTPLSGAINSHVLMRFVDDFLFVSASREKAVKFLNKMHNGFEDYGCEINPKKTCTNFELLHPDINIKHGEKVAVLDKMVPFHWYGLILPSVISTQNTANVRQSMSHMQGAYNDGGVSLDLSRYTNLKNIRDCITVNPSAPTHVTSSTLGRSMHLRVYAICFDAKVNSYRRILRNLYELASIACLQWIAHDLCRTKKKRSNCPGETVLNIQRLAIVFVLKSIRKKLPGQKFPNRAITLWVFFKAFNRKLSQFGSSYSQTCRRFHQSIRFQEKKLSSHKIWKNQRKLLHSSTAVYPQNLRHLRVTS